MTISCSDYRRIVVESVSINYWRKQFTEFPLQVLNLQISWQAQYLVRLVARFICDADQS